MKKFFVIAIVLLAWAFPLKAQVNKDTTGPTQNQLESVLLPMFGNNLQKLHSYPTEKQLVRYYFSYNSFYTSDVLPNDAMPLYDLSVLRNQWTGQYMDNNAQVDPATISYYGYNFANLQMANPGQQIAFRTPGSEHAYLILRTPTEANAISIQNNQYNP